MIYSHITRAVLLVALALTVRKGLHRKCWTFTVQLVAWIVCGFLMAVFPDTFYTPAFYGASRDLYSWLKLAIVLELGYYVFRSFPRALYVARSVTMPAVAVLAVALVMLRAPYFGWWAWSLSRASFNAATIWLFGGVALLIVWYHLPLDRWHAALIGGFTVQLLLSTAFLASESIWRNYSMMVDPLVACWWCVAAWRSDQVVQSVHSRALPLELPS